MKRLKSCKKLKMKNLTSLIIDAVLHPSEIFQNILQIQSYHLKVSTWNILLTLTTRLQSPPLRFHPEYPPKPSPNWIDILCGDISLCAMKHNCTTYCGKLKYAQKNCPDIPILWERENLNFKIVTGPAAHSQLAQLLQPITRCLISRKQARQQNNRLKYKLLI